MFRQDYTCPALLESFHISFAYGLSPAMATLSRVFCYLNERHWPGPRSLATTNGISVDVFSSGY